MKHSIKDILADRENAYETAARKIVSAAIDKAKNAPVPIAAAKQVWQSLPVTDKHAVIVHGYLSAPDAEQCFVDLVCDIAMRERFEARMRARRALGKLVTQDVRAGGVWPAVPS